MNDVKFCLSNLHKYPMNNWATFLVNQLLGHGKSESPRIQGLTSTATKTLPRRHWSSWHRSPPSRIWMLWRNFNIPFVIPLLKAIGVGFMHYKWSSSCRFSFKPSFTCLSKPKMRKQPKILQFIKCNFSISPAWCETTRSRRSQVCCHVAHLAARQLRRELLRCTNCSCRVVLMVMGRCS